jgi:hypothetical protein
MRHEQINAASFFSGNEANDLDITEPGLNWIESGYAGGVSPSLNKCDITIAATEVISHTYD